MLRQACTPKCILGCKSKVPRVSLGELKIDRPEGGARVSELFLCRSCSPLPALPPFLILPSRLVPVPSCRRALQKLVL